MAILAIFASCSQDAEEDSGVSQGNAVGTESVASLVGKLREYDASFAPRRQPLQSKSDKKNKLTWLDWFKVGIADVKGALTGASGGWWKAAVGAAVASIEKYVEIR